MEAFRKEFYLSIVQGSHQIQKNNRNLKGKSTPLLSLHLSVHDEKIATFLHDYQTHKGQNYFETSA